MMESLFTKKTDNKIEDILEKVMTEEVENQFSPETVLTMIAQSPNKQSWLEAYIQKTPLNELEELISSKKVQELIDGKFITNDFIQQFTAAVIEREDIREELTEQTKESIPSEAIGAESSQPSTQQ